LEFEWDEAKRLLVLRIRGLDFRRADVLFDGRPLVTWPTPRAGEMRWISIGEVDGRLIAAVWTEREERRRIIAMRRARHEEERKYRSLYGG
jgi:uncharacterized protein